MTAISIVKNDALITAPYKVDVFAGENRGDVSKQWFSRPADQRFPSLDALWASKKADYEASFEQVQSTRGDFEILAPELTDTASMERLTIGLSNISIGGSDVARTVEIAPTHHAFGQLCALAAAPAKYLRELPSQLVSDQLTYRLKHYREAERIKFYGDVEVLKAATSETYGRIPDFEVVDAIRRFAGDGLSGRWKTPGTLDWSTHFYDPEKIGGPNDRTFYGSDRDVFVFLVDDRNPIEVGKTKNGEPDLMFRGFIVENSEVGTRSLKIRSFYLRAVCQNRCLWGVEDFEEIAIRHSRLAPDRWLQQAVPALQSFAEGSSAKLIEGVEKAKAAELVKDEESAIEFLKNRKFTHKQATKAIEIAEREEGHKPRSAWDMAQAVTAFARSIPNTDDRLEFELVGKSILDKVA